jgi:hypothetical protein
MARPRYSRCWTVGWSVELIVVYMRSKNGFVPEAQLVYRTESTNGDNQEKMKTFPANTPSHSQLASQQVSSKEHSPVSGQSAEQTSQEICEKTRYGELIRGEMILDSDHNKKKCLL